MKESVRKQLPDMIKGDHGGLLFVSYIFTIEYCLCIACAAAVHDR